MYSRVKFFLLVMALLTGPLLIGAQAYAVSGLSLFKFPENGIVTSVSESIFHLEGIQEAKLLLPNDTRIFKSSKQGQTITEAVDKILLPDFATIVDPQERKEAFFEFLTPLVQEENRRLREERLRILDLQTWRIADEPFRPMDRAWLEEMGKRYQIMVSLEESEAFFAKLLEVVDIIPVSLALAQAANESGLGSSRLAKDQNNLFGQVCHTPKCGVSSDRSHSMARRTRMAHFVSVQDSVRYYVTNLNVNPFYQSFRALRADLRAKGEKITGDLVSQGLRHYSELGEAYVQLVLTLIDKDDLTRFDEAEYLP